LGLLADAGNLLTACLSGWDIARWTAVRHFLEEIPSVYTLYARAGSGSIAPQIILEELALPHLVEWVSREQATEPGYLALNPTGKIPTLRLPDGRLMFESAAMVIHLTEIDPKNSLAPPVGNSGHAHFLQWMVFLSANLYETLLRVYYPHRYSSGLEADAPKVKAKALEDVLRHMQVVEAALSPFLLGQKPGAADIYLFMLAGWYSPADELYRRFPKLRTACEAIGQRPAVTKVMAMNV
jgi:glutathione S-transferase